MGIKNEENYNFIYNSFKGDVRVDVISEKPKEAAHALLKVSSDDRFPIRFAYQYGTGLIKENNVSKRDNNILGTFLSIRYDDIDGYISFFNEYGFLFELENDRFIKVEINDIVQIAKRIKTLINLINCINESPTNNNITNIFELSISLIFDRGWSVEIKKNEIRTQAKYHINELLERPDSYASERQLSRDETLNGIIKVKDTIYGEYNLSSSDYRKIMSETHQKEGYNDPLFIDLTYLYTNYTSADIESRLFIDCLFHYYYEIAVPKEISLCEKPEYYTAPKAKIEDKLKQAIVTFGKRVITNEINQMIERIKPVYNSEKMQPDWRIDSLLSALYFSIFYMDSTMEMYRRCAHCGTLFLVKRSSSTKKFCSSYCRNNYQQAKHRLKIKQQA